MTPPWIVLFMTLWLVVVAETVLVLGLSRRLTALEAAGTLVLAASSGTMGAAPVGAPIPRLAADRLAIPSMDASIKSSVILFLSAGCGPCLKLAQELKGHTLGPNAGDDFEIIVVSNEAGTAHFSHIGRTVLDPVGTLATSLGVPGTPFAFAVDSQGIIRGVGLPNAVDDVKRLGDAKPRGQPVRSGVVAY